MKTIAKQNATLINCRIEEGTGSYVDSTRQKHMHIFRAPPPPPTKKISPSFFGVALRLVMWTTYKKNNFQGVSSFQNCPLFVAHAVEKNTHIGKKLLGGWTPPPVELKKGRM